MTGNTTSEGYPYPLTSDFADVQDAYRLATALDAGLRAEQAPFRAFMARPSFIGRQTTTQSSFLTGTQTLQMQATEWDNTGGAPSGVYAWSQPYNQGPSWWLFGCTILVNNAATSVVGDMTMGQIYISTVDQTTGLSSSSTFSQRNDDTGTNGEWINLTAMAPIYQGTAQANLILNGSTLKSIQLGSRFWGMYLGPVV